MYNKKKGKKPDDQAGQSGQQQQPAAQQSSQQSAQQQQKPKSQPQQQQGGQRPQQQQGGQRPQQQQGGQRPQQQQQQQGGQRPQQQQQQQGGQRPQQQQGAWGNQGLQNPQQQQQQGAWGAQQQPQGDQKPQQARGDGQRPQQQQNRPQQQQQNRPQQQQQQSGWGEQGGQRPQQQGAWGAQQQPQGGGQKQQQSGQRPQQSGWGEQGGQRQQQPRSDGQKPQQQQQWDQRPQQGGQRPQQQQQGKPQQDNSQRPQHTGQQQQQRKPQQGPSKPPSSSGSSTSLSSAVMKNLSLAPYKPLIPIETSPNGSVYEGTKGKPCKVQVNYGVISFNQKNFPKTVYHYDISFDPETPKKMLPFALRAFMANNFPNFLFGTDERKNMYTAQKLTKDGNVADVYTAEAEAVMGDRRRMYKITVKYAADIDLSVLLNYRDPVYQDQDKPSLAVQVLDIILRSAFTRVLESNKAIRAGRQVYFIPERQMPLGDGMELWYGLFQSAILGRSKLYLNVDVLHKAFPSEMPVLDFLRGITRDGKVPQRLGDRDREYYQLKDFLAMLSVGYRISDREQMKTFGVNGLVRSARDEMFEHEGRKMSVEQYYREMKNVRLQFPDLPCLWVGSKNKRIVLPMEFCYIPPGQATNKKCSPKTVAEIIKYSATTTDVRKQKILNLLRQINYAEDKTVSGFGIQVDPNFQNIDARVIDPPKLQYLRNVETPSKGVWREGLFLKTMPNEINWAILNCDDRTSPIALDTLKKGIRDEAGRQNINLRNITSNEFIKINPRDRNFKQELEKIFQNLKQKGFQLVIVVVIEQFDCYARVKQAAELKVGFLTQCIKANTIFRMSKGNPQMTLKNILLKLNSKLNGTNHTIVEAEYNKFNQANSGVMFIGADVTHPSPDARNIPSVVGVASSYDAVGFRYACAWRLQPPTREMIDDLENILVSHLQFYEKANKKLPAKILYYRDGVSDGQFRQVLDIEMAAIQKAMTRVYGQKTPHAKVTFIVVQKRHHTRFFPLAQTDKNHNVLPGTVVDKDIMHPFQYQFFMASHAAIQGVTKPTKYCILINESKIDPDMLQAITYDLCHLFTRCNRSVSYPAPTYYAHLVAARGKNYIVGDNIDMRNLGREFSTREIRPDFINNTPMFFV